MSHCILVFYCISVGELEYSTLLLWSFQGAFQGKSDEYIIQNFFFLSFQEFLSSTLGQVILSYFPAEISILKSNVIEEIR